MKFVLMMSGILLCLLLISFYGFYSAIRPFKIISKVTPGDFGVPYESVSFYTEDHVLIRGWYIPSKQKTEKTIILLHGYPADKGDILPSRMFLRNDYNLLLFDFRYLGESEGNYSTIGHDEALDVLAAIDYLHKKGIHEIGVWGFSMGGAAALIAASKTSQIKALIIESSYARLDWMADDYYRIPLLKHVLSPFMRLWAWVFLHYDITTVSPALNAKNLNIPVLLIYSTQDTVVSERHGILLAESLKNNKNAQIIVTDNETHGQPIPNEKEIVKQFFDNYFK